MTFVRNVSVAIVFLFECCAQVDLIVEEIPVSYNFVQDYDVHRQKDGELVF